MSLTHVTSVDFSDEYEARRGHLVWEMGELPRFGRAGTSSVPLLAGLSSTCLPSSLVAKRSGLASRRFALGSSSHNKQWVAESQLDNFLGLCPKR